MKLRTISRKLKQLEAAIAPEKHIITIDIMPVEGEHRTLRYEVIS